MKKKKKPKWRTVKVRVEEVEMWPRRSKGRINDTCEALRLAWRRNPDMRLGQFLTGLFGSETAWMHITDEYIRKTLRQQFRV